MPTHKREAEAVEKPGIKEKKKSRKRVDFHPELATPPIGYEPPKKYRSFRDLRRIGLDIETFDPNLSELGPGMYRKDGYIVGVGVGYANDDATYYPTAHTYREMCYHDPESFYSEMREDAQRYTGEIVGANLQYDLDWLGNEQGIWFPHATIRDVQIAEPLLDENRLKYALDVLAVDYLGQGKLTDTLRSEYGKDYIKNMHGVHPGHAAEYCEADCTQAMRIMDAQKIGLRSQNLTELFDLESRLIPLLLQMRRVGVRIDLDRLGQAIEQTGKEAQAAEDQITKLVGFHVNINAAASIAQAFDELGLEYPFTDKTGSPSFVKAWLEAHPHEIAKLIVRQREFAKIKSTFLENYMGKGHVNGRIHCMFNQLKSDRGGAVSGRFSSSNPNLQNIPARHPVLGPLCRSMFIPEEGMLWGCADWSQIEYRFLVHYASITPKVDAEKPLAMYLSDPKTDFHQIASDITGVPRKTAKSINFGVVYGMGVAKMALDLGVPTSEAKVMLNNFHEPMPFLKQMMAVASRQAGNLGEIQTILGRKRRFNEWSMKVNSNFKKYDSREEAVEARNKAITKGNIVTPVERAFTYKSLNALLQGSSADLMKLAMVQMYEAGLFEILVPHLTVHDEMNVSIPQTPEGHEAFKEMVHIMESAIELAIPVIATANTGLNWDEAK
jgi:DNA polymerase I-like protein with 3'-5' exonuclease and polymerase domains